MLVVYLVLLASVLFNIQLNIQNSRYSLAKQKLLLTSSVLFITVIESVIFVNGVIFYSQTNQMRFLLSRE